MTHVLKLPGLLGSHPLGVLASFGLLRKVSEWDVHAKLSFVMEDDWIATLHTDAFADTEALAARLADWTTSDIFDRLLGWADDVRVSPDEFRRRVSDALAANDLALVAFLNAIATDGVVDGQKGLVKPSAFYMASGQQSFLGGMREIVSQVRAAPIEAIKEAIIGPWRYEMRVHSMGWDPNTERLYALRHRAPTSEKPVCIGGAVLLAFWALPLFPVMAIGGRAATTGFVREGSQQYFTWPVWSPPIGIDELTSLIHCGESIWISETGGFRGGIECVYRSKRAEFGQGYAVLRPAEARVPRPRTRESLTRRAS